MSRGTISIAGVGKEFGAATVLDAVDLTIAGGSFVTLLGPSGCGKTTLLRLIAGFLEPSRGTIAIDGVPMQGVPPRLRPLGMVFQNLALFPHLDVFENVAYGMRIRGMAAAEISGRVSRFLTLVGLAGFERRRIGQLSGGQKQRVALARSLALEPAILLLDEPLSALDLQLRRQLQVELKSIQRQLATTFVFVTHDQEEATMLSDTIVVMNGGHVQQVGTPGEIYRRPASPFVARFVGDINMLDGRIEAVDAGSVAVSVAGRRIAVPRASVVGNASTGGTCQLACRPESVRLGEAQADALSIEARVSALHRLGPTVKAVLDTPLGPLTALMMADQPRVAELAEGKTERLSVPSDTFTLFAST
ncbi:ABC transporter ATP-binding protein [Reyranella aquatilis]|uniref:ABC transporter ATP-binding protein n=1 Tax=Reyranella aquatilis TaxID=2035356 RepID=A0ABS8KVW8_9HYPH|nr:ABC transporter ATP-binding protein [Reyranella aquatilis]MCC8430234.1 ABC transporter ATP-binding protein [Reyranella aquatilis]